MVSTKCPSAVSISSTVTISRTGPGTGKRFLETQVQFEIWKKAIWKKAVLTVYPAYGLDVCLYYPAYLDLVGRVDPFFCWLFIGTEIGLNKAQFQKGQPFAFVG